MSGQGCGSRRPDQRRSRARECRAQCSGKAGTPATFTSRFQRRAACPGGPRFRPPPSRSSRPARREHRRPSMPGRTPDARRTGRPSTGGARRRSARPAGHGARRFLSVDRTNTRRVPWTARARRSTWRRTWTDGWSASSHVSPSSSPPPESGRERQTPDRGEPVAGGHVQFGPTRSMRTSSHVGQCEFAFADDPSVLWVLLKVKPGMGGDYWWVRCGACETAWQVPSFESVR